MIRRVLTIAFVLVSINACRSRPVNQVNARLDNEMPKKILWAWERPEDLRFIDPNEFGVAFLAQTIHLEKESVVPDRRKQPLEVPPETYLIAVTRIETQHDYFRRPSFDQKKIDEVAQLIRSTLDLPDVKAIQVDFDAMASERAFYRSMMNELRKQMPDGVTLSMTSLASWCTGDAWFNDFPVDEAVPMVFQMGSDSDKVKNYLRNGHDWREPLCRGSYGVAFEEGRFEGMKSGRRMYFFKNSSWGSADMTRLLSESP